MPELKYDKLELQVDITRLIQPYNLSVYKRAVYTIHN